MMTLTEILLADWTFLRAGNKMFSQPRHRVLRNFVLHHLIHHRTQVTVYMCRNAIPLPGFVWTDGG